MDSRWFLAGAIVALLILLFDKPLAQAIEENVPFIPGPEQTPIPANPPNILPSNPTGCGACSGTQTTIAAPASPIAGVRMPGQSHQLGNRVQPAGSPAPRTAILSSNFVF